ncbi:hypothetical protein DLD82_17510 [Methanospirillum stamsii]|uniref:Uncharacterized protein n=1 Tax=Methanospirillum stamsii TaxID=1277351 RepID=A0A2V2MTX3_9EURY|nr:hypothetical protein DLD82_17510 [Methanospirillum stamsii]
MFVCGKPAIGIQFLGCCASAVCEDHAERYILSLAPGERLKSGSCTFVRYSLDEISGNEK